MPEDLGGYDGPGSPFMTGELMRFKARQRNPLKTWKARQLTAVSA
jgi:hypothetical protein